MKDNIPQYKDFSSVKTSLIFIGIVAIFFFGIYYFISIKILDLSTKNNANIAIENIIKASTTGNITNLDKLKETLSKLNYPIIITKTETNFPVIYLNIDDFSADFVYKLTHEANKFTFTGNEKYTLYYSIPKTGSNLQKVYLLYTFLTTILFIIGIILFSKIKNRETVSVWSSLSKEAAHQLGTPVTSLKGWQVYLNEIADGNDEIKEVSDGMLKDIDRIELVTNRLSNLSEKIKFDYFDISKTIKDVTSYISKRISANNINIITNSENISFFGNEVLLYWSFENIIKNSIEAIPENIKGEITVNTTTTTKDIIIDFSDNGEGIPASVKNKIFDTGFTTKKRGHGIGLALASRVIKVTHKGKIFIKSTSKSGTTIRIVLPKHI